MEFETTRPLWAVLIGILVIPFLVASGEKRANQREAFTILASLIKAGVVLSLLPSVLEGRVPTATLWEITPGVSLALRVDGLGMVFGMVASVLWILTSFYSIGYVRGAKEHKQTRFYASFAMAVSSTIGIAFAANLVTFLIFFEMLTMATYPLVIHKETDAARKAANKYLAYTIPAGLCLVLVTAWCVASAGSVDFVPGGFLEGAGISMLGCAGCSSSSCSPWV